MDLPDTTPCLSATSVLPKGSDNLHPDMYQHHAESDPGGPDRGTVGGVKDGSDDDFYGKNWDVLLALGYA